MELRRVNKSLVSLSLDIGAWEEAARRLFGEELSRTIYHVTSIWHREPTSF